MLVTELVPLEALREAIAHATDRASVWLVCHVGLEVTAQLGSQCVSSATLEAQKGPLPRVQALMSTKCMWVSEGLPTHRAQVGLTSVGNEMTPQLWKLGESTGTVWALIRTLPCVQPQVSSEVAPLAECSPTVWAQEWLFSSVKSHVVLQ